jgi:hypothetical protein
MPHNGVNVSILGMNYLICDMDYDKFKSEYVKFTEDFGDIWESDSTPPFTFKNDGILGSSGDDVIVFGKKDPVNNPAHYTRGKSEAIDVIADAIGDAPTPYEGFLQGQVLKYMLRMWLKDNPTQDAEKAQWYLSKLIDVRNCHN